MAGAPLVSVVIPAFRAGATIRGAIASALAGGVPEARLEILVEADDGGAYAAAAALSPAVRVATGGGPGSGPGPARNRAMARARGAFLAFLDADDRFAPGYLAALLPLARAEGAAAAPLRVEEGRAAVLSLWDGRPRLGFADLAATGASVRLMVARHLAPPFAAGPAQDILQALLLMARQGGSLPLSPVPYRLRLRRGSVTAAADFAARAHAAYLAHAAALEADPSLPPAMARAAAGVFRAKVALNAAHAAEGAGRGYYRYIADRLAAAAE